jgi:hypothetical protein
VCVNVGVNGGGNGLFSLSCLYKMKTTHGMKECPIKSKFKCYV